MSEIKQGLLQERYGPRCDVALPITLDSSLFDKKRNPRRVAGASLSSLGGTRRFARIEQSDKVLEPRATIDDGLC